MAHGQGLWLKKAETKKEQEEKKGGEEEKRKEVKETLQNNTALGRKRAAIIIQDYGPHLVGAVRVPWRYSRYWTRCRYCSR